MKRSGLLVLSLVTLAACSAKQLRPEAAAVRIVTENPGKKCKYLGEVTGTQGDWFTGQYTSNENLEIGARNDMKNKAYEMGGNVLQLLNRGAGQKGTYGMYGGSSHQSDVTYTATVYRCP